VIRGSVDGESKLNAIDSLSCNVANRNTKDDGVLIERLIVAQRETIAILARDDDKFKLDTDSMQQLVGENCTGESRVEHSCADSSTSQGTDRSELTNDTSCAIILPEKSIISSQNLGPTSDKTEVGSHIGLEDGKAQASSSLSGAGMEGVPEPSNSCPASEVHRTDKIKVSSTDAVVALAQGTLEVAVPKEMDHPDCTSLPPTTTLGFGVSDSASSTTGSSAACPEAVRIFSADISKESFQQDQTDCVQAACNTSTACPISMVTSCDQSLTTIDVSPKVNIATGAPSSANSTRLECSGTVASESILVPCSMDPLIHNSVAPVGIPESFGACYDSSSAPTFSKLCSVGPQSVVSATVPNSSSSNISQPLSCSVDITLIDAQTLPVTSPDHSLQDISQSLQPNALLTDNLTLSSSSVGPLSSCPDVNAVTLRVNQDLNMDCLEQLECISSGSALLKGVLPVSSESYPPTSSGVVSGSLQLEVVACHPTVPQDNTISPRPTAVSYLSPPTGALIEGLLCPSISLFDPISVTSDAQATPSVSQATSSVAQATPSVSQATPSVSQATPSVSQATPTVSQATPTVSQATPSNSQATPSNSQATPSVAMNPSSNLQTTTSDMLIDSCDSQATPTVAVFENFNNVLAPSPDFQIDGSIHQATLPTVSTESRGLKLSYYQPALSANSGTVTAPCTVPASSTVPASYPTTVSSSNQYANASLSGFTDFIRSTTALSPYIDSSSGQVDHVPEGGEEVIPMDCFNGGGKATNGDIVHDELVVSGGSQEGGVGEGNQEEGGARVPITNDSVKT